MGWAIEHTSLQGLVSIEELTNTWGTLNASVGACLGHENEFDTDPIDCHTSDNRNNTKSWSDFASHCMIITWGGARLHSSSQTQVTGLMLSNFLSSDSAKLCAFCIFYCWNSRSVTFVKCSQLHTISSSVNLVQLSQKIVHFSRIPPWIITHWFMVWICARHDFLLSM